MIIYKKLCKKIACFRVLSMKKIFRSFLEKRGVLFHSFCCFLVSTLLAFYLRKHVPAFSFEDYKDMLNTLVSISSIIFAIIGAWIAIVYPKAIESIVGNQLNFLSLSESDSNADYLADLVEILMVSAVVLISVLFFQFLSPILKILFSGFEYKVFVKFFGFVFLSTLTFLQIYSIFRVVCANYFFLNNVRNKNLEEKSKMLRN